MYLVLFFLSFLELLLVVLSLTCPRLPVRAKVVINILGEIVPSSLVSRITRIIIRVYIGVGVLPGEVCILDVEKPTSIHKLHTIRSSDAYKMVARGASLVAPGG